MSAQLSIYWQAVDQLQWYWADDNDVFAGTLEELLDHKQQKNTDDCVTRLFLPSQWFTSLDIPLPPSVRSVNPSVLKFAVEEHIAQDIDSVHLVLKAKAKDGKLTVIVTELERFRTVVQTLQARQFIITEAYDAQWFSKAEDVTEDLLLQLVGETVTVYTAEQVFNVHYRGFSQWFELWQQQQQLAEDASVRLVSDSAEGIARSLSTELESTGLALHWVVQPAKNLRDWHEQAGSKKQSGNLMTGEFAKSSGDKKLNYWVPSLVASVAVLAFWCTTTLLDTHRLNTQTDELWQASEDVFTQVFGKSKRIQRPLMVREMRTRAASAAASADTEVNALTVLSDLDDAAKPLLLEDFRFNGKRNEVNFTIVQPTSIDADAYASFEALKSELLAKDYQVEYAANQDSDAYRARFKATVGGQ